MATTTKEVWMAKFGKGFAAIDLSSGGYPYEVEVWKAHHFPSEFECRKYCGIASGLTPMLVQLIAVETESVS